ncbi:hypothetical protein Pcinc_028514 [Petrolisthes cinctipes]|uniref:Uncharacterized protein n=1 Tax=Petrolisthes cinctipes TaxID=88211 RepID=A0AAE1K749_PETCI|nr:hypothetical protein Pcinc_028514 [Petrolisthes cinctipes]
MPLKPSAAFSNSLTLNTRLAAPGSLPTASTNFLQLPSSSFPRIDDKTSQMEHGVAGAIHRVVESRSDASLGVDQGIAHASRVELMPDAHVSASVERFLERKRSGGGHGRPVRVHGRVVLLVTPRREVLSQRVQEIL